MTDRWFHVELSCTSDPATSQEPHWLDVHRTQLRSALTIVTDALGAHPGPVDVDTGVDLSTGVVDIGISTRANDHAAALGVALGFVRSALHRTPGWIADAVTRGDVVATVRPSGQN